MTALFNSALKTALVYLQLLRVLSFRNINGDVGSYVL